MINLIPKSIVLGTCTTIIAGACYALIPTNSEIAARNPASATTKNGILIAESVTDKIATKPDFTVIDHLIKPGESLSVIFSKLDIDSLELHKIIHSNSIGKQFASILPGKILRFETTSDGELQQLSYPQNPINTLVARRFGENFQVEKLSKDIETRLVSAQASIQSSLFLDAKNAGLSDKTIMELANLFAWDVDFALNLRSGDQFTVLYEKHFAGNQQIATGDILVAEFVNNGRIHKAVRFKDKKGKVNYYSPEGKSLRKAFLRTPIEFARISSRFNLRRKHPVRSEGVV